ncbi:Pyridoxamine 5'-phosphate oxidase [Actinacidiphila yanglinensis]|uniref:Pyridoxamine 5'-phosphate oxidase n=1 Tax=Actinacidiphila yanglinensis TaxID=310779 RepID=A0A1H6D543_9ACTN|nr:pyridoxamine 5'-phosphate oxidase family protein [Actinacidiphila yanglinensis]SEG80499.1 Pyridoxamine 5'-phosphate oxidase [Actinacidiphila yanglinensis]
MYSNAEPITRPPDPRVLARRVAERRLQLGLSEGALATQAGMAPRYLQHLLGAGVDFDPGGFVRIAAALHLSYEDLIEGRITLPPGQGDPVEHPALHHLTVPECWDRLGSRGVGRVALPVEPSPAVIPVNYAVDVEPSDTQSIVYRTARDSEAAPEAGAAVSFEVDRVDDHVSQGWSVLVTGVAEHIDDPAVAHRLTEHHDTGPWTGDDVPLWVRICPDHVSGRRIGLL